MLIVSGNIAVLPDVTDPKSSELELSAICGGDGGWFTVSVTDSDAFPPFEVKFKVAE